MDYQGTTAQGKITSAYRALTRLHNRIPYHLSRNGRAFPTWHYFFEITRRCNLRCKMCQYIDFLENVPVKEQGEGELTTEEWLSVVDQVGPLSLVTFTGGEVWLRKDFATILERACKRARVHFISNAVMLKEDKAQLCVELAPKHFGMRGLNFVGVSIDGTEEVHNKVRAQKEAYSRSMAGIRSIIEARREQKKKCPLIHMNTVVMNDNMHVLPDMPEVAADAGVNVLNLLTETRAYDNQDLGYSDPSTFGPENVRIPIVPREELDEALRKTLANATKLGVEVRMPRMPYDQILDHYDGGYDLKHMACGSIWTNVYVGAKGGVYPCFINNIGNVRENTLKELWNSEQARRFRTRRRDGAFEVCRGCCEMEYTKKALPGRAEPEPGAATTGGEPTSEKTPV